MSLKNSSRLLTRIEHGFRVKSGSPAPLLQLNSRIPNLARQPSPPCAGYLQTSETEGARGSRYERNIAQAFRLDSPVSVAFHKRRSPGNSGTRLLGEAFAPADTTILLPPCLSAFSSAPSALDRLGAHSITALSLAVPSKTSTLPSAPSLARLGSPCSPRAEARRTLRRRSLPWSR